ncbi:DMT family transporter [Martelella sp. HB161492]|uniref:DMT family transporter n=1 Tax=Martelella sp. HB161492 TaxID=2720726 RepID=UPI0015902EDD|nr:DMT family transporter [Martelella sp. HB161492]
MNRLQANGILLLAAAIWGGGFVAQSTAMAYIGPYWFIGIRFLLAALVVLPFALAEGARSQRRLVRHDYGHFALIGIALFGGSALQQVGIIHTSVTNSSFLTGLYVLAVPAIALIILRKPPHPVVWPAALMALGGIYLLSGGNLSKLNVGDWLTILCALFWAAQMTLVGLFVGPSGRPLMLSAVQFLVCGILGVAAGLITGEHISLASIAGSWTEILYVGVVSSGVAFALQVIGQRYTTAPQAAIFLSMETLFGALGAALFLHERLVPAGYLGCALMFLAIIMVELLPELGRKKQNQV